MMTLLMSLEGHLSNFQESIIDAEKFSTRVEEALVDFRALQPYLSETWNNET